MKRKFLSTFILILIGVLFGAVLVSGLGWVRPSLADIIIGADKPPVQDVDIASFNKAFIDVAEKVTPSIVRVAVVSRSSKDPHEDLFFFFPFKDFNIPREQMGSGSGVIISEDGYILTNNHVVENATKVQVGLSDQRILEATVIGTDPLTDLAIIKVEGESLTPAFLGNSDDVKVGQWVMAIGNPLSLASTVTAGIVSAKGRNINIIKDNAGIEDFIQTDAAINPGNSGGALVDLTGAVIGINTAIAAGNTGTYIGYGFAIPINMAKNVAKELIAYGKVKRGYIGVNIGAVDPATAKAVGLDKARGVMIQGLLKDGAAEDAGLKEGDIILKIDEKEVNRPNELQSYIASKTNGTKVSLQIFRDGKEITKSVTLKSREEENENDRVSKTEKSENSGKGTVNELTFDNIGISVKDLSPDEKKIYKVDDGILITDVKSLSKAYDQNLFRGLVIVQVDRNNVKSVREFESVIKDKKGSAILLKVVDAKGNARFVGLEIPE